MHFQPDLRKMIVTAKQLLGENFYTGSAKFSHIATCFVPLWTGFNNSGYSLSLEKPRFGFNKTNRGAT